MLGDLLEIKKKIVVILTFVLHIRGNILRALIFFESYIFFVLTKSNITILVDSFSCHSNKWIYTIFIAIFIQTNWAALPNFYHIIRQIFIFRDIDSSVIIIDNRPNPRKLRNF